MRKIPADNDTPASPQAPRELPRYRLLQPHHMAATPGAAEMVLPAGTEVETPARPSEHMEPLNAAARQAVAAKNAPK